MKSADNKKKNAKNIKDNNGSTGSPESYSLYTENIVEKPSVRYHKLIRFAELVCCAVVFGIVAAVVFVVVYEKIESSDKPGSSAERTGIVIEKDEYPYETDSVSGETGQAGPETYDVTGQPGLGRPESEQTGIDNNTKDTLQNIMQSVSRSTVRVTGRQSTDELQFGTGEASVSGVIFAEVDAEYFVITGYDEVADASRIIVRFADSSEVGGHYLKGDADTGIAVISIKQSDMTQTARSYIKCANLGNSYMVRQGDTVIAAGRILGADFGVNQGIATSVVNKDSLVDSYLGLIYTNMAMISGDYGYLFDATGNLIGIPVRTGFNGVMSFYGISDLKALIEELSNGYTVTYCGIIGENITADMASAYGLPAGVYVREVKENSPAFQAGIQSGDVITSVNDETVLTFSTFSEKIYKLNSGDKATINVKRLGKDEYKNILFSVTLGSK